MPEESQKNQISSFQESCKQTKCSALIPDNLLVNLKEAGFENRAEAIRLGLECLLNESISDSQKSLMNLNEIPKTPYKTPKESLKNQWESIGILKARNEELESHNKSLKRELEQATQDKEDLKATYNNYFMQVQTLINKKAIEAPGQKKWWRFWG